MEQFEKIYEEETKRIIPEKVETTFYHFFEKVECKERNIKKSFESCENYYQDHLYRNYNISQKHVDILTKEFRDSLLEYAKNKSYNILINNFNNGYDTLVAFKILRTNKSYIIEPLYIILSESNTLVNKDMIIDYVNKKNKVMKKFIWVVRITRDNVEYALQDFDVCYSLIRNDCLKTLLYSSKNGEIKIYEEKEQK